MHKFPSGGVFIARACANSTFPSPGTLLNPLELGIRAASGTGRPVGRYIVFL